MGIHADDAVNEGLDEGEWRMLFGLGLMSLEDATERGILDEFGCEPTMGQGNG